MDGQSCYNRTMTTYSVAPPQPQTVDEALRWLSEARPGSGFIDASRIIEMSGIQQSGGYLTVGLNTTPADLIHSSLVRGQATCLAEAARYGQAAGALVLGAELTPTSALALALVALSGEIELARLQPDQTVGRTWQPLPTFLANPPSSPFLPVAVRLEASKRAHGSAFVPAPAVRGASASLHAAAASLRLDGASSDAVVIAATIALLPRSGAFFCADVAAAQLIGQPVDSQRIAAAAQQAQIVAQALLGPTFTSSAFPVHVAAHLVRKALDRAAARGLEHF